MTPNLRNHNVTRAELAPWLTMSRNLVAPTLARFGILPLSGKFPMPRIYLHLLGVAPADADQGEMLGQGMVRLGAVADRVGRAADDLLNDLRRGKNDYPPLYVLGPRQHLFLRAQIQQMILNPRNSWHAFTGAEGHSARKRELACALNTTKENVDLLLADKMDLPAHILFKGQIRFILSDVRRRLEAIVEQPCASQEQPQPQQPQEMPDDMPKGIMARALQATLAGAATGSEPPQERPRSGPKSREGGFAHGKTSEAKLS